MCTNFYLCPNSFMNIHGSHIKMLTRSVKPTTYLLWFWKCSLGRIMRMGNSTLCTCIGTQWQLNIINWFISIAECPLWFDLFCISNGIIIYKYKWVDLDMEWFVGTTPRIGLQQDYLSQYLLAACCKYHNPREIHLRYVS